MKVQKVNIKQPNCQEDQEMVPQEENYSNNKSGFNIDVHETFNLLNSDDNRVMNSLVKSLNMNKVIFEESSESFVSSRNEEIVLSINK